MEETFQKFPNTIFPQDVRIGEEYVIVRRRGLETPFEIIGPFTIVSRARRITERPHKGHFRVEGRIAPVRNGKRTLFLSKLRKLLSRWSKKQQKEPCAVESVNLILPLGGHSTLHEFRYSLHERSALQYFEKQPISFQEINSSGLAI